MKKKILMIFELIIISIGLLSFTGCAKKIDQIIIKENTTYSKDTVFEKNVVINEGVIVTVEKGVTLTFDTDTQATVNGDIVVNGNIDVKGNLTLNNSSIAWNTLVENGTYSFYKGSDLFIKNEHIVGVEGDFTADIQIGNGTWSTQVSNSPVLSLDKNKVYVSGKIYLNKTIEDERIWNLGLDGAVVLYEDNSILFEVEQDENGGSYAAIYTYGGINNHKDCNLSVLQQNYFYSENVWKHYSYDLSNGESLVGLLSYYGSIGAKNQKDRGGVQTWNGNTTYAPNSGPDGQILQNIKYTTSREGTRNVYDLWLPKYVSERQNQGKDVPVIVFLHGGSWTSGVKEDMNELCAMYAKMGYVTATLNYRLSSQEDPMDSGDFLDMINDVYKTVLSIKTQLNKLGYISTTMAISGQSAGGHIAMLYAATYGEDSPIPVKLVLDEYGPTDFSPESWANARVLWDVNKWGYYTKTYKTLEEDPSWEEKFYNATGFSAGMLSSCGYEVGVDSEGNLTEEYREKFLKEYKDENSETYQFLQSISPVLLWENYKIPFVGIHGEMDPIVSVVNAQKMKAKLEELNVDHYYIITPVNGHSGGEDASAYSTFYAKSKEYLEKYLKLPYGEKNE